MPEKDKKNDAPLPGKTREMSEEKIKRLVVKPMEDAKPIFDYLARWRAQSEKTTFSFS